MTDCLLWAKYDSTEKGICSGYGTENLRLKDESTSGSITLLAVFWCSLSRLLFLWQNLGFSHWRYFRAGHSVTYFGSCLPFTHFAFAGMVPYCWGYGWGKVDPFRTRNGHDLSPFLFLRPFRISRTFSTDPFYSVATPLLLQLFDYYGPTFEQYVFCLEQASSSSGSSYYGFHTFCALKADVLSKHHWQATRYFC